MIENSMICRIFASVAVVLGLLITPAIMPSPAEAVTVNLNIGSNLNSGRRISCAQGERLLRYRGFRDMRRIDCRGDTSPIRVGAEEAASRSRYVGATVALSTCGASGASHTFLLTYTDKGPEQSVM